MDRTACVDLPAFPLQLLLRGHPDWKDHPVAVVDRDKPQGELLWVNERARSLRILPGMRYAAGLALARDLRVAEMARKRIDAEVESLGRRLRRLTPSVEPARDEPGVFWLDASGLERLHDSLLHWAEGVRRELCEARLHSTVVVGYSRFGTYALSKAKRGLLVLQRPADETAAAQRVPLDRLALEPRVRDALDRLGVRTVGDFIALPGEGLRERFGDEAHRLHRSASGLTRLPLQPEVPEPPPLQRRILDHPECNVERLQRIIEQLLPPLLETLAHRRQALIELIVGFRLESKRDHLEAIRPAAPTLDAGQLLELVRLRLQAIRRLPQGVMELRLLGRASPSAPSQQPLFADKPRRDPQAANRALARVRAELGDAAVVHAQLREGHLPEGSFTWEALDDLAQARPRGKQSGRLIRRLHSQPIPLPPRPRQEPDGWMLRGLTEGPVVRVLGPYVVSGGWWRRAVHREYHFAETRKGELLWVYYDRVRRRWFLQGRVE